MRNKISAGDLLSAESILEVHKTNVGEDSLYLEGLAWLARGALLLDQPAKARRYAADVRRRCESRIADGANLELERKLSTALGASIEVEAQLRAAESGRDAAATYLRGEIGRWKAPLSLTSRLHKRLALLTLERAPAPELVIEDHAGVKPRRLAELRGKPVMLYLWAEWCGDARAQSATLQRIVERYAPRGLQTIALTRYYDEDRTAEKARVEKAWKENCPALGNVPLLVSTASMERYGGSSTPTFVFIGRDGVVRGYTPTRLTEEALDQAVAALFE
jgi:thiol-disulfide isomerase/thioredoxin